MPETNASYAPAPAPPQKRRSFAGAIVLIAIGVVFLLGNMHVITWLTLWRWFAHYWPVLLILYGAVKLVEYQKAKHDNVPFSGIGAGGVVLVIFIIVIGLTASGIERMRGRINWNEIDGNVGFNDEWGGLFGNTYNFDQQLEQDFPAGATLKVVSDRGDVNIVPWDENRIKVEVTKKIRAESQEEANKLDQATQAGISVAGNEVTLKTNISAANKPAASDLQIFVPKKAAVNIDTRNGDVSIADRVGDVKIADSGGDISIANLTGNVDVTMRPKNGSFQASKVTGNVSLDGRFEDTNITDISGSVTMTGDFYGDTNMAKIAKAVTFRSSRTDLQLAKLDGNLNLQSGELRADSVTGPVTLTTRSKDINLTGVSGDIRLDNSNGTIDIHPAKLGQIMIENRRGDITITIPADAEFQLNARTRGGDINTDFGIGVNSSGGQSMATGTVGKGGPKVEIISEHGDVAIRKSA